MVSSVEKRRLKILSGKNEKRVDEVIDLEEEIMLTGDMNGCMEDTVEEMVGKNNNSKKI